MFLWRSDRRDGEGRQRSRLTDAAVAAVVGLVLLAVIMVVRFALLGSTEPTESNVLSTAPPETVHDGQFTARAENEKGRICEIHSAVLTPGQHSSKAETKYVRLPSGRLVSRILEPVYGASQSSFKALLTSASIGSAGDTVIEDAEIVFTHDAETKASTLAVEAPEGFSVVEVGAIITDTLDGLQSKYLDPAPVDPNNFYYRYIAASDGRKLTLRDVKPFVLARNSAETTRLCGTGTDEQIDPSTDARCAGPYYIYSYAKVCKDNSVAPTKPLIDLVFAGTLEGSTRVAFEQARDTWNGVIKNTFPEALLGAEQRTIKCNGHTLTFPAGTKSLDGLMIFALVHKIDGEGGILAQAGPCAYSDGQFGFRLPRVGLMEFDIADVAKLSMAGTLSRVVLHEMAHVLGMGVHWASAGLLKNANTNDPRYLGEHGVKGYKQLQGARDSTIPVANTGGGGTAGGHWREAVFGDELMTGYSSGANTLSIMTIRSLADLGFVVDVSKAEDYALPGSSIGRSNLMASASLSKLQSLEARPSLEGDTFNQDVLVRLDLVEPETTVATPTKLPTPSPTPSKADQAAPPGRHLREQQHGSNDVVPSKADNAELPHL